ncbi:hypothetical protein [Bradyrhizobium sp. RD5-C2]|uniref:hypothetical protein n=1 Tax=Bradyrhizobium sp. RD5-C2 TaxID=244562 RepID=UPI001CC5176B|nr:hypothetical protein [Bradyrhizobium sp. RD5-C2]
MYRKTVNLPRGLARAEIDIVRSPRALVSNGAKVGMSRHIMLLNDAGSQLFEH